MRSLTLVFAATLIAGASDQATAQRRDETVARSGLPRDVSREATRMFNETTALRSTERLVIDEDKTVDGDVAVLNGPLLISGRVRGRVVAINSDVVLRPSARIEGDLWVVGGEVEGRHAAYVGGEIRIYRQALRYTRDGDRIFEERGSTTEVREETDWWRRWERSRRSGSKLQIASAGAYNRVEGLPINLGPQIFWNDSWGSARIDAYAVLRTETSFSGARDDLGHNVNLELRLGRPGGLLLGGRAFSLVEATESWKLTDLEAALAAFLARRDYRDYYEKRGGQARAGLFVRKGIEVTGAYSEERWTSRAAATPWTLTRRSAAWRPNPTYDDALLHLVNGTIKVDTRNDTRNPWSGWYMLADYEQGTGTVNAFGARSAPVTTPTGPMDVEYQRVFADLRRYNRIGPNSQFNLRLVAGGWVNGDPLPLQRRFSLDGAGTMPGYDFRSPNALRELTCSAGAFVPGIPGQCDRMALAQVEYRGDLHFDLFTDWDDDHYMRSRSSGVWVFFADAGRGWLVGTPGDSLTFDKNQFPKLSTFKTDLGLGLDFTGFGVYVAKAMNSPIKEPVNFFLRIKHRF